MDTDKALGLSDLGVHNLQSVIPRPGRLLPALEGTAAPDDEPWGEMESDDMGDGRLSRWWIAAIGAAALVVLLMQAADFYLPMNRDSGTFAYGGWRILSGGIPYRDFWDNKPPGIFYLNALAFALFGPRTTAVVWLQLPVFLASAYALYRVYRLHLDKAAAAAALTVYALYASSYALKEEGNFTECYSVPFVIGAVWLAERWRRRRSAWLLFASGVLVGMAALARQSALSDAAAIALWVLIVSLRERGGWPAALGKGCVVALGVLAAVGPVLVIYATNGLLGELSWAVYGYNRLYFRDAYTVGWTYVTRIMADVLPVVWPLLAATVLTGVVRLRRERSDDLLLPGLWFASGCSAILMAGRFYPHYFVQILPACALFFGYVFQRVVVGRQGWARKFPAAIAVAAALAAVGLLAPQIRAWRWIAVNRVSSHQMTASEATARYIRDRSGPRDYVYVWGMNPTIAFMAQRRMSSRYIHLFPLEAATPQRKARIAELARDLRDRSPEFIVDESELKPAIAPPLDSPYSPPVAGFLFRLDGFDEIKAIVREHYRLVTVIKGEKVFARR